ncbi:uncharacterized protein EI90DRAFT_3157869 [Cantharellus anzutake]|uniref:uncharacterized protein n=1 Tax=Cantharellus anzutake TaxID=1750568 RepID=UPI0019088119|nr:uncharacterized protein EI90DRAFT_3157869 [Cantharellus anzutake]KAF8321858.1 hypothetical protein EI90DRAFT_3157869 [Cantharellus anzutake]
MAMHSISDLTTSARNTTGDIPPPLVGASTTVVGDKMYLFGGRLHSVRRMTSDLYLFDLRTSVWKNITPSGDDGGAHTPTSRYFHSADSWNGFLIIFGGMGYASKNSDSLCVLNDVRLFSLAEHRWIPAAETNPTTLDTLSLSSWPSVIPYASDPLIPRPRYAHLSSITASRLFIIGGQDMSNTWLDDIHVFDLSQKRWVEQREYPRHCGTYRSVAVASSTVIRDPVRERVSTRRNESVFANVKKATAPGDTMMPPHPAQGISDQLVFVPYSDVPSLEYPAEIHLYSNYNFTDVQRELEVFTPSEDTFHIMDKSDMMSGAALPPGLRFPTGVIIGKHLIIAGTYLAQSYQSFSLWALDLDEMTWSRIDPGTILTTGSWSRGALWTDANIYVIFGNRAGNLVEDYNRRLLNWDHVVYIELEAFGMYTYPSLQSPIEGQIVGLDALEVELFADFEILCEDGRKIKCSRKLLEERWPWFRLQRAKYIEAAKKIMATQTPSEFETPLPDPLPEDMFENPGDRPDPRLTPRMLRLSEPYPITKALLQYFYTGSMITPLQHAPLVLSALLLLSAIYELPHLSKLVKHIMHQTLSPATSVGVYEVATLCDSQNLQIRALRVVMSSSRKGGGRSSRLSRHDRSDRPPTRDDSQEDLQHRAARARGMSDAVIRNGVPATSRGLRTNGHGGSGSNEHEHSRDLESERVASRQNSSTNLSIARANLNVVQVNTGLLKAPEEDPTQRGRSDSDTRGRSFSNAVPMSPGPNVPVIREGSVTPTQIASSSEDQQVPAKGALLDPRRVFTRQTSMNSLGSGSIQQRLKSPPPERTADQSKMGFGRRALQDAPPSEEISPDSDSPAPTPPIKDQIPISLISPMSITAAPALPLAQASASRPISRKQSANTLVDSSSGLGPALKSSRRRSLSDAGPSRPNTADSVQTLATSIVEVPHEDSFENVDLGNMPPMSKNSLPRKAFKILGDDNYDPSSDIYISDPRSDKRKTSVRPGTAESNRPSSPEKSKKLAWRSRLLPNSTEGKKGLKAVDDKVSAKTKLTLWGTGTKAVVSHSPTDDDFAGSTAEKLINAHLL